MAMLFPGLATNEQFSMEPTGQTESISANIFGNEGKNRRLFETVAPVDPDAAYAIVPVVSE